MGCVKIAPGGALPGRACRRDETNAISFIVQLKVEGAFLKTMPLCGSGGPYAYSEGMLGISMPGRPQNVKKGRFATMLSDQPIGFFDSGLGGVSVLREAVRLLPHENFIYFGDDKNAPYGVRSEDEIKLLSLSSTDYLASRGVKAIVVACNTATSIAVESMRQRYSFPVISMEPAIKPAADMFSSGSIAVLATPATLRQERLAKLIDRLGVRGRVRLISCTELAGLIERGEPDAPELRSYIHERLSGLRGEQAVNALVMGCTHYTFAAPVIREEAKQLLTGACRMFDGAAGTARQLQRVLSDHDLLSARPRTGRVVFLSSGGEEAVRRLKRFFRFAANMDTAFDDRRQDAK